jgi:hypothetical protein
MVAIKVGTWTLDCSHTTAIKVSSEGRPGAVNSALMSCGLAGGVGRPSTVDAIGMIRVDAITDVVLLAM